MKTAAATRFHGAQLPPRLSQLTASCEATNLFGSICARVWLTLLLAGTTHAFHVGLPAGTLAEGSMESDGIDITVSRVTCFEGTNLFDCACACISPTLFLTPILSTLAFHLGLPVGKTSKEGSLEESHGTVITNSCLILSMTFRRFSHVATVAEVTAPAEVPLTSRLTGERAGGATGLVPGVRCRNVGLARLALGAPSENAPCSPEIAGRSADLILAVARRLEVALAK